MRIRALPVVFKAVHEGVQDGLMRSLEEGKKPENAGNPDLIREIVAASVLNSLMNVIDFGDDLKMLTFPNENQPETKTPPEDPGY